MPPDLSAASPDYLVLGHLSSDFTTHAGAAVPPSALPSLGGTAAYAALTARALGRRPALVTSASSDLDLAPLRGIPVTRIPAGHSTTFRNDNDGAGRTQTLLARAVDLDASAIPVEWRQAAIVHLAPIAAELPDDLVGEFSGDRLLGITPQGWMRAWDTAGRVSRRLWRPAPEAISEADAVIVSLEDVHGDETEVEELASIFRLLVLTESAAGARVYWNGDVRRIPAPAVAQVDPTGAGDIFAAAFFVRLHQTRDPWEAARFANLLAAASVSRIGLAGVPTPEEARQASLVWVR